MNKYKSFAIAAIWLSAALAASNMPLLKDAGVMGIFVIFAVAMITTGLIVCGPERKEK